MKKNIFISVATLLSIVLLGVSCKPKTEAITENKVSFDSVAVDKTYHLLNNTEYPNCNLQIKFKYPANYPDKDVLEKIRKHFISAYFGDMYEDYAPQEAVEHYTNQYLEDYKSLEPDFKAELESMPKGSPIASWYSYYEMSSNEITFNKGDILSFSVSFESYTGGAHGAHSSMNHVINLKTGDLLTEEDIFVEDYQDTLATMMVDKIAASNEVENPKELESIGFFSVDEIYPNGNFSVDDTGITYQFNEYEIAAYVVGIVEVRFTYAELKDLLKKESPIARLVGN